MHTKYGYDRQNYQEAKVEYGKLCNVAGCLLRLVSGVLSKCYKACERCNKRTRAANIDSYQQLGIIICKLREKNG